MEIVGGLGNNTDGLAAVNVTVTVAGLEPGVTLGGLNEHAASDGSPLHEKVMALVNAPFCGVTVSVAVAGVPRMTVMLVEEIETL